MRALPGRSGEGQPETDGTRRGAAMATGFLPRRRVGLSPLSAGVATGRGGQATPGPPARIP